MNWLREWIERNRDAMDAVNAGPPLHDAPNMVRRYDDLGNPYHIEGPEQREAEEMLR